MRPAPATFLAMVAAWAAPLACLAGWQMATTGRVSDLGATAFWVGGFTLVAWLAFVLPFARRFKSARFFSDRRLSWLGWSLLAAASYSVLVLPLFGWALVEIVWYPAAMGCVAGLVFAMLVGKKRGPSA